MILQICLAFGLLARLLQAQDLPISSSSTSPQSVQRCQADSNCPTGQFCWFNLGACGGSGQCQQIPGPNVCDVSVKSSVCGCDGKTYTNLCVAHQSKASIVSQGDCSPAAVMRNDCASNEDCPNGTFCNFPNFNCSDIGQCSPVPVSCTEQITPVCGCDGLAYQNECMAKNNGVSLAKNNTCFIPTPCEEDKHCTAGLFCQRAFGKCSGSGYCLPKPPQEGCLNLSSPVCGCNGQTYKNQCFADQAGVSTLTNGTCPGAVSSEANPTASSSGMTARVTNPLAIVVALLLLAQLQ